MSDEARFANKLARREHEAQKARDDSREQMEVARRFIAKNIIEIGLAGWERFKDSGRYDVRRIALKMKCKALISHDRCLTEYPRCLS